MFPSRLSSLPGLGDPTAGLLPANAFNVAPMFVEIGGGGGGGFPGGGGIQIGIPPIGSGGNPASGGGSGKTVSLPSTPLGVGASMLSNLLGIPAINWGRIAAFLLGLILIAGGIYLIRPVNQIVNTTVKRSAKAALAA